MFQNYGAGVQACYRGPRLYDTPETKKAVVEIISWYKKYRNILNSDIIHLRKPDARDWDGIMHVAPAGKEKGLGMIPKGKTLLEAFEILDHFQAYEYLLKNLDRPLTEELLKETHRLLTEHTLSYKTQYDEIPSNPGEYTTVDMCAGDTIFGDHEQLIKQVPRLLQSTQQVLDSGKIHPMIIAARFHGFYEYLHPFRDGNGRLGRLMSNFILLKKEQPLLIIPSSQREEYITALKYIKKERTDEFLIDFFFRTSIKRMEQEIKEKKNLTENFIRGMEFVRNVKSSNDDILEI